MIKLKIFDNFGEAIELYDELGDRLAPEMSMALNRAASGVKTDVTRHVARTREIKREELKNWRIHKSVPSDLHSSAVLGGRPFGIEKFALNAARPMYGRTTGGVTATLPGGKTVQFRHGFVGSPWGGGLKVFTRDRGKRPSSDYYNGKRLIGRFPLSRLFFIGVPQMADDEDVTEVVVAKAEERFLVQFDHVVNRLVEQYA